MEKQLISVIVPIYRVELQLDRCVESLTRQTYGNLEIILVDDGSPDGCGTKCDAWSKKDGRIRVIHKKNAGLGMARNSGLDIAKGDWIVFVDGDDYVLEKYVEGLYSAVCQENADLAVAGYLRQEGEKRRRMPVTESKQIISEKQIIDRIFLPVLGAHPKSPKDVEREMCVWRNIYKREIVEKYDLRFVSEREYVSEDILFNMSYFLKTKRAVLIPDCVYVYCDNPGSLTNSYRPDRMEKYCRMLAAQTTFLKENGLYDQAKLRLYRTFIMKARRCVQMIACTDMGFCEAVKECRKILKNETLGRILKEYRECRELGIKQRGLLELMYRRAAILMLLIYQIKNRWVKRI